MQDTSEDMKKIQREIIFLKTINERFMIGADSINFGRMLVVNNIMKSNPGISDFELKLAVLNRYYENYFSKEEFVNIVQSAIHFYSKK